MSTNVILICPPYFRLNIHKHCIPFLTCNLAIHIDYWEIVILCKLITFIKAKQTSESSLNSSWTPESWVFLARSPVSLTLSHQRPLGLISSVLYQSLPEPDLTTETPGPSWAINQPYHHSCFILFYFCFIIYLFLVFALFFAIAFVTIYHTTYFLYLFVELDPT